MQNTCHIMKRSVRLVIYRMSQLISVSDLNNYKSISKIKSCLQLHCLSHPNESAHFVFKSPKEDEKIIKHTIKIIYNLTLRL